MLGKFNLIFDAKKSMRTYDDNGYLHVAMTPISKACVNPYVGREIPDWYNLDLQPDRIYYGLRDPEELKKSASTFNGLPLLLDHHPISSESMNKEYIVGSTGTDATFDGKYLKNSLAVHDAAAIRLIEDGSTKEISCAYRFVPDFTPGTFEIDGSRIRYDFVMRNLSGNHVALVAEGRAGHDVAVADAMPKNFRKENGNVRQRKVTRKVTRRIFAADSRKKKLARDSVDSLILEFAPGLDEEHRAAFKAALAVAHQAAAAENPPLGSTSVIDEEPTEVVEEEIVEEAAPEDVPPEETAPAEEVPVEEDDDDAVNEKVEEVVEEVLEGGGKPEEAAAKLAENLDEKAEDTDEEVEEAVADEEPEPEPEPDGEPAEDAGDKVDFEELMKNPEFKAGFKAGLAARKAYEASQAEDQAEEETDVLNDAEEEASEEEPLPEEEPAEDAEPEDDDDEEEEPAEDAEEDISDEEVAEDSAFADSIMKLSRTAKYALDGKMISRGKAAEKFGASRIRKWTAEAAEYYREDPSANNDYWTTQGSLRITFDSRPRTARHASSRKKAPVFDSRTVAELKARVAEDVQKRCRELNEAAVRVRPLIGTVVDPLAYDSAEDIYAIALKQAGKDVTKYARSSYKDMVDILVDSKPSYVTGKPTGRLDDKDNDCFKYLKNISR